MGPGHAPLFLFSYGKDRVTATLNKTCLSILHVLPYTCHIVHVSAQLPSWSHTLLCCPILVNVILFSLHVAVYSLIIVIYSGCEVFRLDLLSCSP